MKFFDEARYSDSSDDSCVKKIELENRGGDKRKDKSEQESSSVTESEILSSYREPPFK